MRKGETFRAEMAGSGGYGEPFERDPRAVAEDVRQEKISAIHAKIEYGVIVDAKAVLDVGATSALRQNKVGATE
jgi:N-methylhydantoinase B/oxoprolinase/acetone carboxylase alpha subunit